MSVSSVLRNPRAFSFTRPPQLGRFTSHDAAIGSIRQRIPSGVCGSAGAIITYPADLTVSSSAAAGHHHAKVLDEIKYIFPESKIK